MRAAIEMMLLRAMSASAAREESRRRNKEDWQKIVCSVCGTYGTYGGTMYKRGSGYVCRDCRRKEKNDRKTD